MNVLSYINTKNLPLMKKQDVPIKSFIRIKPGNKYLEYTSTCINIINEHNRKYAYTFDKVFGPNASQKTIYKNIQDSITRFKEGYNTTIFCYGNTGAGKTYTMIGSKKAPGLVYNIVYDLLMKTDSKNTYDTTRTTPDKSSDDFPFTESKCLVDNNTTDGIHRNVNSYLHQNGSTDLHQKPSPSRDSTFDSLHAKATYSNCISRTMCTENNNVIKTTNRNLFVCKPNKSIKEIVTVNNDRTSDISEVCDQKSTSRERTRTTNHQQYNGQLEVSYIEIYNEKIYDLLDPKELVIREYENSVICKHMYCKKVEVYEDFVEAISKGNLNRRTGETKLNKCSSRSHSILRIKCKNAILNLIDLAGSENNKKTGNEGMRLTESSNINRSLFVLTNVVNAIINKEKRIPYRDSKLTRLLQDSIGGSSLCYVIANIIDDIDYNNDTLNTLKFASKSREIVNSEVCCERKVAGGRRTGSSITGSRQAVNENDGIYDFTKSRFNTKNKSSLSHNICALSEKTNTPQKSRMKEIKSHNLLSPNTMQKSYKAFHDRAMEFERLKEYKKALDDYKTLKKINDNAYINERIEEINKIVKKKHTKSDIKNVNELLDILNSGNFVLIKKLKGVGDKRAQSIIDYVNDGNYFTNIDDLNVLFTKRIISSITSIQGLSDK